MPEKSPMAAPDGQEKAGKIRLSLDVTPEMKQVIDDLAANDHATVAQVMRQAIALLKTVKDAEKKGERPALIDEDGNITARLIGV